MQEITIEEGKDMDFILKEIINMKVVRHNNVVEIAYLHRKFLNEKGKYYCTDLIYKIFDHIPQGLNSRQKRRR